MVVVHQEQHPGKALLLKWINAHSCDYRGFAATMSPAQFAEKEIIAVKWSNKNPYKLLWLILKPSPFWFPASREGPRKALWLQQSHCLPEGLKKKSKENPRKKQMSLRGVVNAFLAPLKTSKLNQLNH